MSIKLGVAIPLAVLMTLAGCEGTLPRRGEPNPWYRYNDGGRLEAGYHGVAKDCVVRSISIATGRDYREVSREIEEGKAAEGLGEEGVRTDRPWFRNYMESRGWRWETVTPKGQACRRELRYSLGRLPEGTVILGLEGHYVAAVNGVLHDTFDPSRGKKCVLGYWSKSI